LILGHGLAHIPFVVPGPEPASEAAGQLEWPFDLGRSWLVGRIGVEPSVVRVAGRLLTAITIVTALLAALATAGILIPAAWWSGLVAALAISSALLLAIAFSPTFVIGVAIDLALLWLALVSGLESGGVALLA